MYSNGAFILRQCIEAEYHHQLLLEEYEKERERIIAGHYPSYETKYGTIQQETISTENAVIYMIEAEERIKDEMKPLEAKRSLLKRALRILTNTEKEVFNHVVWGFPSDMQARKIEELSIKVNEKLCNYLNNKG